MKARFYLQTANYGRGIDMRLVSLRASGDVEAEAQPAMFKTVEEGQAWSAPFMTIGKEEAQSLIDELWHIGFRPERGQMSVGQIAATEKHLEDMRHIVFNQLKVAKS